MHEETADPPALTSDAVYGHVGRRLRSLRMQHGQTQAQVARVIAVSPQQYQKYEDAQSKCSLPYLLTLADHYGVHVNAILPVDAPEPPPAALDPREEMATEADLLARLVSAFVQLEDSGGKLRLVQLVEAIVATQDRAAEAGR